MADSSDSIPIIGITIGDPAGIGPEIVCKMLAYKKIYSWCHPVIIGNYSIVKKEAFRQKLKLNFLILREASSVPKSNGIGVVDIPIKNSEKFLEGKVSPEAGYAAYDSVIKAISLADNGMLDAITTGPLTKASLKLANVPYIDHTEILSAYSKGDPVTMLATRKLRVAHVMRHLSLAESIKKLSSERILKTIIETAEGIKKTLGVKNPKLIVAGLNPHNGDGGIMGDEEKLIILPAIIQAQNKGYDVIGPVAADSAFPQALLGFADAVVALYHDQGHIAVKANDWRRSFTITVGLNIIRTSPNHGSALDIAGKNIADENSILEALYQASIIAKMDTIPSREIKKVN